MEIRELARQVLFSPELSDKTSSPAELTDLRPGAPTDPPSAPERPLGLRWTTGAARKTRFPKRDELHCPVARGRALHFFANHELLAAELMALCILRFPEAPAKFRLGVAQTLVEEQDHLRRYRSRMGDLGVDFGEVAVSGRFWRLLAGMRSPMDFVTGMSLVFEQANLDHAARWVKWFAESDDLGTSALMARIVEEEVGHVRHGVYWFERWRAFGDPFEVFKRELPDGLDAIRAKGEPFQDGLRRRAGLSEDFIRALRRHRQSRGRRPRLFVFCPDVEEHASGRTEANAGIKALIDDLAPVMGFLGRNEDVVWTPRPPRTEFLEQLSEAGLPTPRWISKIEEAAETQPDEIHPWGWSKEVARRLEALRGATRVPFPELDAVEGRLRKDLVAGPRSRFFADGRLQTEAIGRLAQSIEEVTAALEESQEPIVIKARFSASGRHRWVCQGTLTNGERKWIDERIVREGGVWVERWLARRLDLGLVFGPYGGEPSLLRFFTDSKGRYLGHFLGHPLTGSPSATGRLFSNGLPGLIDALRIEARKLVPSGPVGVDLMVYQHEAELRLQPLVEINARYTMGHIAAALRAHLAPARVALWWHVRANDLRRAGLSGFPALEEWLKNHPVETILGKNRTTRICGGILPTNDPLTASRIVTLLSVAHNLAAAARQLGDLIDSERFGGVMDSSSGAENLSPSAPDELTCTEGCLSRHETSSG